MAVPVAVAMVTIALALTGLLVLRQVRKARGRAAPGRDGYQEIRVTINGRYCPHTVEVEQGVPVRLRFLRREDNPCSERVVFSKFGIDRRLAAFQETVVEFVPSERGTFLFTCQWGMYRGKLVVIPPRARPKALEALNSERTHGRSEERE